MPIIFYSMSESTLQSPYAKICPGDQELTQIFDKMELDVTKKIIQLVIDAEASNDNAVKEKETKDTDNDQYKSGTIEPEEHESFKEVQMFMRGLIGMTFVMAKNDKKTGTLVKDEKELKCELNQCAASFVEDLDGKLNVMERNGEVTVLNQLGEEVKKIFKTTIIGIRNSIEEQLPQQPSQNVELQNKPKPAPSKKREK